MNVSQMSAIYCPHAIVPVLDRALVSYRVATVSRIDETIGLFGRILSVLWGSLAKETYNLWILLTKPPHMIIQRHHVHYIIYHTYERVTNGSVLDRALLALLLWGGFD